MRGSSNKALWHKHFLCATIRLMTSRSVHRRVPYIHSAFPNPNPCPCPAFFTPRGLADRALSASGVASRPLVMVTIGGTISPGRAN
jgi:hypothetical protein